MPDGKSLEDLKDATPKDWEMVRQLEEDGKRAGMQTPQERAGGYTTLPTERSPKLTTPRRFPDVF